MNRLSRNVPTLINLIRVCDHGSINKAAEVLNISQPALTRSITRLEQSCGVELLHRNSKGVTLTEFGEILLMHARNIESELRNTLRDFAAFKNNQQKDFRIGATPLVAAHFMAGALEAVYSQHPGVSLRLTDANRPELLGLLRRGELDLVVATLAFDSSEADLTQQALFELDLRVIVRTGHPLAKLETVTIADLQSFKWVLPRADSGLYRRVERDFNRAGITFPGSVLETTSPEATKALVKSTDLIGVLPLQALSNSREDHLVSLQGDWSFARRSVGIFRIKDEEDPKIFKTLVRSLRNIAQVPVIRPKAAAGDDPGQEATETAFERHEA